LKREGKISKLLTTFNTLADGDQDLVMKFMEDILNKDCHEKNIINNSDNELENDVDNPE
jgi:hypothetical protein